MKFFAGKRVVVTGSCGTIGSKLVENLLSGSFGLPNEVVGLDTAESELFFQDQAHAARKDAHFFLCNVRDREGMIRHFRDVDFVFHAAALKHVFMCERAPMEAVQTNISGVQAVIEAANTCRVGKVIFTSSDKAVNPTNVMGASKLMGEKLISAANLDNSNGNTIFSSTRFGNVLGSNGSVFPIFLKQIAAGGPVTLTDPQMTRFVMSADDAARLVLNSAALARGAEVFITKMPVVRIADLAQVMIDYFAPIFGYKSNDIEIKIIGVKAGEKIYEELMSHEEIRRSVELDNYFCVKPAISNYRTINDSFFDGQIGTPVDQVYISSNLPAASPEEVLNLLRQYGLLHGEKLKFSAK